MKTKQFRQPEKQGLLNIAIMLPKRKTFVQPGNWPTHSWYVGYAPYEDPEIAVVAFVYNGGEGASVAAPIVQKIMQVYFELKLVDGEGIQ